MAIQVLSPDSYSAFREAKRLVKEEFDHTLSLQNEDWLDNLHVFGNLSRNTRLRELCQALEKPH